MLAIYAVKQIKNSGHLLELTVYDFRKNRNCHEFFNAQFNYCPLFGCFTVVKVINNKFKHLHVRCSQLIYSDKKSSYENLLEQDNSVSMHHKNIQASAIEMLCSEITGDTFMERTNNQYNLRNRPDFIIPEVNSVFHGTGSISYLRPKIWDIVPEEFKYRNF